jgi:hypothetical protein
MLRSDVSGKYVIPTKAIRSAVSNKVGLPDEIVTCDWLEQPILRNEVKRCTLTGRMIASSLLNPAGELIPLRELLDGRSRQAIGVDEMIPRLCPLAEAFFRGLKHVWVVWSPGGRKLAVCGEVTSWFGLKVRYIGFILNTAEAYEISGRAVRGYRGKDGWHFEDDPTIPS